MIDLNNNSKLLIIILLFIAGIIMFYYQNENYTNTSFHSFAPSNRSFNSSGSSGQFMSIRSTTLPPLDIRRVDAIKQEQQQRMKQAVACDENSCQGTIYAPFPNNQIGWGTVTSCNDSVPQTCSGGWSVDGQTGRGPCTIHDDYIDCIQ